MFTFLTEEKNLFWTNKKFVYLIFINKLLWYHPKIMYENIVQQDMNKFLENVLLTNCREGCRLWKLDIDHEEISQFRIIVSSLTYWFTIKRNDLCISIEMILRVYSCFVFCLILFKEELPELFLSLIGFSSVRCTVC